MPIVQPPTQRHTIQDDGSTLRITIPSRKHFIFIIFVAFWLFGWALGEIIVGYMVISWIVSLLTNSPLNYTIEGIGSSGGMLFMLFWLVGWTAGGGAALYTWLWQLVGKEIIEVGYNGIKIRRVVLRLGRQKEYLASHIKDLRAVSMMAGTNPFGWRRTSWNWGLSGGSIAFDYGVQTFRFGIGVDEAEAKQIVERITGRFPQYRRREVGIE